MAEPEGMKTPLVLVAGLPGQQTEALAVLLLDSPGTAVVHHDLRDISAGVVRRRFRHGLLDHVTVLELAHGCVSCTLREDLLPLLRRLAESPAVRRIVVQLDPSMEPEPVCWALQHALVGDVTIGELTTMDGVLSVVDRGSWLTGGTGGLLLAERGLGAAPDDDRTVAQVAVGQVEFADAIVVVGQADAWTTACTGAVLDRLAPAAPRRAVSTVDSGLPVEALLAGIPASARRGELDDAHGPLLRGEPPLDADCGVAVTVFRARRPFHPQRLHESIDMLLTGVVRTRGRVWVASQPDVALWLESAGGGLRVGHAGAWLAAVPDEAWDSADPARQAKAALDWDPRFGDRLQELVIISHLADPAEITESLTEALLTDDELAAGERDWLRYFDPFGDWHADPCDDVDIPEKTVPQQGKDDGQRGGRS